MAAHVGHMIGTDELRAMFRAVTETGAELLHLEGYGLEPGCNADLVVLQAGDPIGGDPAARDAALRRAPRQGDLAHGADRGPARPRRHDRDGRLPQVPAGLAANGDREPSQPQSDTYNKWCQTSLETNNNTTERNA